MAFLLPLVAGPLVNIVGDIVKRILPAEKMSEEDRAKLEQELQLAIMKQDWTNVEKEFADRADARALAKADVEKGNWFSNILAATVRPVWGYASLIVVIYPYVAGALGLPAVALDEATKSIVQLVICFYFGGRSVERIMLGRNKE